jgi:hypothetical protein
MQRIIAPRMATVIIPASVVLSVSSLGIPWGILGLTGSIKAEEETLHS